MTARELLSWGEEQLSKAGIDDAKLDAWYLLEYSLPTDRVSFLMKGNNPVTEEKKEQYEVLIEKRASHIPVQHLTGVQDFMGLTFKVNEHVLIPRQDTEVLVEEVLKVSKGKNVLDMCTGSGCIIISLAKLGQLESATAVDISTEALKIARENAASLEADVSFVESDLFEKVEGVYDIIVSNPPYIESEEVEKLEPEVKDHEPRLALDGTEDGLYFYRKIIEEADKYLTENGAIFFEIGYNQGEAVSELLRAKGYQDIKVIKDLPGLDRVVAGKR